jgi:NNP family nitrate/nitrite transporter-like MFS transporter
MADWRPDDETFWQKVGRRIANRNLWLSMPALLLGVRRVGGVERDRGRTAAYRLPVHPNQLFWLAALPGLVRGLLPPLYSFVVPIFGGRNWTVFSTALLLLPTLWIGVAVQDPNTKYPCSSSSPCCAGWAAGNFSSSMANISFFFPQRLQGTALGLNAASAIWASGWRN